MKDVINSTFDFIEQQDETGLIKCLKVNADIQIIDILDERGYTLLHEACF